MKKKVIVSLSLLAVFGVFLGGCAPMNSSDEKMSPDNSVDKSMSSESSEMMGEDTMMKPAGYVTYDDYMKRADDYAHSKIVLFFNAPWCPACKASDKELKTDSSLVPPGVTLVSVDYDSHTDLRKSYGVTMQHTFVQVGENGEVINKWSSNNLSELSKNIK